MHFNSIEFFIFLPIVFVFYWYLTPKKLSCQNLLLLIASYIFYGYWSWKFLILLAFSTLLDFGYGFGVASNNKRKSRLFLWLSIINNLGILAIFKYYDFFANQINTTLIGLGLKSSLPLLHVALPVGISFYTFHGMSYVFDIYRGLRKPVNNFIDYAVFVCFFPLLVAGPIERANHLLPQVQNTRKFEYRVAVQGCRLMLWGLFKKVVIADNLANIVNDIFANYQQYNAISLLLGAIGFSFQIYCDFSGYTDIALGTAKLFGFELLSNFKFPYFSRNIAEFWRRWHISLSSWFRDYLYIPLGGSRMGKLVSIRNILVIFLVSGFWHGANWNFIIWGGIHACGFIPLFLSGKNKHYRDDTHNIKSRLPYPKEFMNILGTFIFVTFAWIFFRIHSIRVALAFCKKILTDSVSNPVQFLNIQSAYSIFYFIFPVLVLDWQFRHNERELKFPANKMIRRSLYYTMIGTIIYFLLGSEQQEFIYFKF